MKFTKMIAWFEGCSVVPADGGGSGTRTAVGEIKTLLAESMEKQRGVGIYVGGAVLPALVTEIGEDFVVARSREASRIVVRIERIDAVTMS